MGTGNPKLMQEVLSARGPVAAWVVQKRSLIFGNALSFSTSDSCVLKLSDTVSYAKSMVSTNDNFSSGCIFSQLPRVELVEVDLCDDRNRLALAGGLPAEIVHDELLVGGVEPEPRRQVELGFSVSPPRHLCSPTTPKQAQWKTRFWISGCPGLRERWAQTPDPGNFVCHPSQRRLG